MLDPNRYDVVDAIMLGGLLAVIARTMQAQFEGGLLLSMLIICGVCLGWKTRAVRK